MAWFGEIAWPVASAVLDGGACAGDGHEGIHAVFEERHSNGGTMAFAAFDLLELDGRSVMREPWRDQRKRLESLFDGLSLPRVDIVSVTDDAATLYEAWVGWGG